MGSLCLLIAKVAFHRQSSRSDRYLAPPAIVILGRLATLASRRRRPETFPRLRSPRDRRVPSARDANANKEEIIFHPPSRSLARIARAAPRRELHAPAVPSLATRSAGRRMPHRPSSNAHRSRRPTSTSRRANGTSGRKRIRLHTLATGVAVEVVAKANMVVRRTSDALTT